MRVQFTNEENILIQSNKIAGIEQSECFIPVETTGKVMTLGIRVLDPFKFNMFIKKFIEDDTVKDQIGAEIAHIDVNFPVSREDLFYLKNYIEEMIYGVPEQQEEQSVENEDTNS